MINIKDVNKAFRNNMVGEIAPRKVRLVLFKGDMVMNVSEFIDEDNRLKNGNLRASIVSSIKDELKHATRFTLEHVKGRF